MMRFKYFMAASILLFTVGCQNGNIENVPEANFEDTNVNATDTSSVTVSYTDISRDSVDTEEKPSEDSSQEKEDDGVFEDTDNLYQAYYDFIKNPYSYEWDGIIFEMNKADSDFDYEWDSFRLVDFDGDNSDELIVTNRSDDRPEAGMQYYLIIDWYDGKIEITELEDGVASAGGYRGTKYYIPGKGIIYDVSVSAPYGNPGFDVYELSEGKFKHSAGGYVDPDPDYDNPGEYDKGTLYWDGKEVSVEKFKELEAEYSDNYSGIALEEIDYLEKERILEILEKGKDVPASEALLGGWKITPHEAEELPEDAQKAFDKAKEQLTDGEYTPVSLLATQLVAGTNYCILCQVDPLDTTAEQKWTMIYIYADLQGNVEIMNTYDIYIAKHSMP